MTFVLTSAERLNEQKEHQDAHAWRTDTGGHSKKVPSASQGEGPQKRQNLLIP
jgi:hypothetical protein